MLSRNRLLDIAVRGCIAAILGLCLSLNVLAQPIGDNASGQSRSDKAQEKPQTDNTPLILEAIKGEIARVTSALEANIDKPKSAEEEDRARRDLDAQEKMALWAKWMFVAAAVSVVITIVGVYLIWRTLEATRKAGDYAKDAAEAARLAVEEAERATKAAQETVDITRENARIQLRAYVTPVEICAIQATVSGGPTECVAVLKNSGQTPARKLRVLAATAFVSPNNPPFGSSLDATPNTAPLSAIGPGAELIITVPVDFKTKRLQTDIDRSMNLREVAIFFWGVIEYEDIFSDLQTTAFRYVSRGGGELVDGRFGRRGGYRMVPHPSGQEAT